MKKMKKIILDLLLVGLVLINFQLIPAQQQKEGKKIIQTAEKYLGNPYVYGGNSLTEGCDCSHFVWLILKEAIKYEGSYVTSWGFETRGEQVLSIEDAIAGDVICYGPHVAIYDGQGLIYQAKGEAYGITHDRQVDYCSIVTIRRFKEDN